MVGFGWLSDPLTAADQTGALSRLLAWSCLAAAAFALIVAIYFTFRALTIREPQRESDLESEGDGSDESFGPNLLLKMSYQSLKFGMDEWPARASR
jgi:hypothetical protein